jgi:Tol biopolymer transport system component
VRVLATGLTGDSFVGPIAWSADSRLLAYATDSRTYTIPGTPGRFSAAAQLFVVGTSGGRPSRLTHEPPWAVYDDLAFTRGSTRLRYTARQVQSDRDLYAVQPDGTELVRLTNNLFDDVQPAWSPDGARLVFLRRGINEGYPFPKAPGLYTLDPATRTERGLGAITGFQPGVWPAWSSLLAYTRGGKIVLARPDGTLVRLIGAHGDPRRPTWSPDGSQLAFADRAETELLVVRADGTGLHEVADVSSADTPAWSPDGAWIAFSGRPTDAAKNGLWIVHPDGTGFRLVSSVGSTSAPAWSPDSSQLLYESYVSGAGTTLRLAAIDGSADHALQLPVTMPATPAWRR